MEKCTGKKHRVKKIPLKRLLLYIAAVLLLTLLALYLLSTFTTLFGDRDILGGIFGNSSSSTVTADDWEGIYKGENGTIVIQAESETLLQFSIQVSGEEGNGTLTSYADMSASAASYSEDGFSLVMTLTGDTISLEESSNNPYTDTGTGFAGEYRRTEGDPDSVDLDVQGDLPDTISETLLNDRIVSVYLDPDGRYTAYFPCLFTTAPEDLQPEDGVYLENDDGNVHITVTATAQESQTQAALAAYLESSYGGKATARDDGSVFFEHQFKDGNGQSWTEVICLMNTSGMLITLNYVFVQADYDFYAGFYSLLGIGVS